jgi:polynucleotide 5'-kinase involved in rRNA processing
MAHGQVEGFLSHPPPLKGTVLFLGAADTGKTFLSRQIADRLLREGKTVCIVDLDVGQQSLALPATIAMRSLSSGDDPFSPSFERMIFIGALSPMPRMERIVEGAIRLLSYARSDAVLVDTTGFVQGEDARRFKLKKIEAIRPDVIIAIERGEELEHILSRLEGLEVFTLRPSPKVRRREREERQRLRRQKFEAYFAQEAMGDYTLNLRDVKLFPDAFPVRGERGRLIGLNGETTLALGILEAIEKDRIFFRSPIPSDKLKCVREIVLGDTGLLFEEGLSPM